jgi:hypothetical protein
MLHLERWRRYGVISVSLICLLGFVSFLTPTASALPVQPHFNHFLMTHTDDDQYDDNQPVDEILAQQDYANEAYPNQYVDNTQVTTSYNAQQTLFQKFSPAFAASSWQQVGPVTPQSSAQATYTGRSTVVSGRTTALAASSDCSTKVCDVWVGAAGGGVWHTSDGLATTPTWVSSSIGLTSNAIGSIVIDPTDHSGKTLYVGTGEPDGSSDSEAGVGLFKSTNGGKSWTLVPGSVAAAKDRSIGAIAIDPTNPRHIYIGTAVARHGTSSTIGGRYTPPDAPTIGLYESLDGGKTFKLVFSRPSDAVDTGIAGGNDYFRGGISKIQLYAFNGQEQVYFSMFDYGLFRGTNGTYEQVFTSPNAGSVATSSTSRTEFALAPMGNKLRIYLGDSGDGEGEFYRVDNANVPASTLTDGTTNPGWTQLSNENNTSTGYDSYDFCEEQCTYDMFVMSPAGHPDTVWLGGSMNYDEIFTNTPPSNGRAVMRSTNAGVSFTDMTDDMESPPLGMHPDQHALAFDPNNPEIAFIGSDGGVVRTGGTYTNDSSDCATRGISGTDLANCERWLAAIPTRLYSLNAGLATIQFQSVTVNPHNASDLIGGTQDNGTFAISSNPAVWTETVGGDGGQSVIDTGNPNIRMHTYYGPEGDVNFNGNDPNGWDYWGDPLDASGESASFYVPLIGDPQVGGTVFVGLQHVWRTQDDGGPQAYLDQHCNEITGDFAATCGDWVSIGQDLTSTTFGTDKSGNYISALQRASSDKNTLWAATRSGRLFISTNANAAPSAVSFTRLDTSAQPNRFISSIVVDPGNPDHAFVSFSGYNAYTPNTPGHVFDVLYNPATGKATWKDISANLGDQPITSVAYDGKTGNLYAGTDFGVNVLPAHGKNWIPAAKNLPMVAVYGLTLSPNGRVLYAATHGRGAWSLSLQ